MQNLVLQGNIYVELLKSCFIVGHCAIALPLSVILSVGIERYA